MSQQVLSIFKAHSGGAKASTEGVLEIMDPDQSRGIGAALAAKRGGFIERQVGDGRPVKTDLELEILDVFEV